MKRKELQKIINTILLTSYVGTLTPIYAINEENISLETSSDSIIEENSQTNQTSKTEWLKESVAKSLNKDVLELTDEDYLLVTELSLSGKDILDSIPSDIGKLKNLRILDLSGCGLTGKIPSEIENLTSLEVLKLYNNELDGVIPRGLYKIKSLKIIELMSNNLSGTISEDIKNLVNLESINLSNNKITGNIPSGIGALSDLTYLDFEGNSLAGNIPSEIGLLNNIKTIRLNNNNLSGNIPNSISNLTNLEHLNLASNNLEGSIPENIGNLTNLKSLNLYENNLSGAIPNSIGNLNNLDYLVLHSNKLTGSIPSEIGNLTNLKWLAIQNNKLTGTIPTELTKLKNLSFKLSAYVSSFANNNLTGSIPDEWSFKKSNESFENNFLDNAASQKSIKFKNSNAVNLKLGEKFDKEAVLKNVVIADKKGNATDEEASNLFNIVLNESNKALLNEEEIAIKIGTSYLSASVEGSSMTTSNKITLQTFNDKVDDNFINREVARQLGKNYTELLASDYEKITSLNLSGKNLSGSIPSEIFKLTNLEELDLSNNNFSGEVPSLTSLKSLKVVNLSNNKYSENINSLLDKLDLVNTEYNLSYNQLYGALEESSNTGNINIDNNLIDNAENQKGIKLKENTIKVKLGNTVENIKNTSVIVVDNLGQELFEALNNALSLEVVYDESDLFENKVAIKTGTTTYKAKIKGSSIVSINEMTLETYNDAIEDNFINREVARQLNKSMTDIVASDYSKVTTINLKGKDLTGEIPSVIEKLTNLENLDLSDNHLKGEIPFNLVESLSSYNFSNNEFTGKIPSTYRARLDESKFKNNFLAGFENQKELISVYEGALSINTKESLNIKDVLSNIKVVDAEGSVVDIEDKYEIVIASKNEDILNSTFTALKPGEVYINAYLKDKTTNETILSKEDIILVKINDTIAPEIKSSVSSTKWTNKAVTITVNATDNDAIDKIVLPNGSSVKANKATYSATKSGTYEFKAYDRAGNSKSIKVSVSNIDVTKPKATITVSKPDKNNKVTITVKPTDTDSKVKSVVFEGKTYAAKTTHTFTVAKKNTYKLSILDNAGNEYSTTIYSDKDAPKITSKVSTSKWTNKAVTITVNASDNDVLDRIVMPDGKTVKAKTATFSATKNGTYKFTAYDRAGNSKSISVNVKNIDTTKPTAKITISKPDKNNKVTIKVASTDKDSKAKSVIFDGKTYVAKSTNSFTVTKNANYKVTIVDNAGNKTDYTAKVSSIPKTVKYTVNTKTLSVRKTMSSKGTLLGTLKKSEKVDVHKIKNGWAKITYKGSTGYVTSSSLKK